MASHKSITNKAVFATVVIIALAAAGIIMLLVIGLSPIEREQAPTVKHSGLPQPRAEKPRTKAASTLPMVELRIPHMY